MLRGLKFYYWLRSLCICLVITATPLDVIQAFAFVFAKNNGADIVAHPIGYNGTGGNLTITVGIDQNSTSAADMEISVQNVINTFNQLDPTNGNLTFGAADNVPNGEFDFESVLLHELGHSLGLAHPNLGSITGVSGANTNYTNSQEGTNAAYDLDPGADGIIGSADDLRGDDENLNYFPLTDNNPFTPFLASATIDATTYARDITSLPGTDSYSTNPDRTVANDLGFADTEAVMQQGTSSSEGQRSLNYDDVAGLRYAMSGIDEIQGTADDYTFTLQYAGLTTTADIMIDFDNSQTGFAVSSSSGGFLGATNHIVITGNNIYFNDGFAWFFNNVSSVLPVEFASFTATRSGGYALLDWSTASESNSSHFIVERSGDAVAWESLDQVTASGNSSIRVNYNYEDRGFSQAGELVYYRLKQVDFDGSYMYSEVITLSNEIDQNQLIYYGPNPYSEATAYELELAETKVMKMYVYNQLGQVVFEDTYVGQRGRNRYALGEKLSLQPGIYILSVVIDQNIQSHRFLVQ